MTLHLLCSMTHRPTSTYNTVNCLCAYTKCLGHQSLEGWYWDTEEAAPSGNHCRSVWSWTECVQHKRWGPPAGQSDSVKAGRCCIWLHWTWQSSYSCVHCWNRRGRWDQRQGSFREWLHLLHDTAGSPFTYQTIYTDPCLWLLHRQHFREEGWWTFLPSHS